MIARVEQDVRDVLGIGDRLLSFNEYVDLVESVSPIKVEFGVNFPDLNDNKFIDGKTFIQTSALYYKVHMLELDNDTVEVDFSAIEKHSYIRTRRDLLDLMGTWRQVKTDVRQSYSDTVLIFGKVMYVVSKWLEKETPGKIVFSDGDPALGKVYRKMMKNKQFNRSLKSLGYEYVGYDEEGYHTFQRPL